MFTNPKIQENGLENYIILGIMKLQYHEPYSIFGIMKPYSIFEIMDRWKNEP